MKAYATVEQLAAAWTGYEPGMEGAARSALSFASAAISSMLGGRSVDPDLLRGVTCRVVARMLQSTELGGVTQESWTASPYGGSVSYANPTGDIYLTAFERRLLGIDGGDMSAAWVLPGEGA